MPKDLTYLEAIREALAEEMRRDPKVFVLGEDVGPYGGAFGVTQGLCDEFGEMRVIDTPISESAIIGVSIGAALRGYRPVAEMQFADFISCGFDQIVNQAATLRYRYGGRQTVPIVVRAPSGGNVGGGLYHSQNPEAWFIHRPGLKVVAPSTAWDAKGLLKAAIRDDNPVVYFEHKYLYRRAKGPVPEGDEIVPIGVAATRREGSDVTLLTYGAMVTPSRGRGPAVERGRRSRGHRSPHAHAVRQGRHLRVAREDEPCADRPRGRQDARARCGAIRRHHGRAVRPSRCARAARDLSRHALPVLARPGGGEPAERRHDFCGTEATGGLLIRRIVRQTSAPRTIGLPV
jgi:transketolase C-terminal domain/subunit